MRSRFVVEYWVCISIFNNCILTIKSYLVHLQVSISESTKVQESPEAPDSLLYFFPGRLQLFRQHVEARLNQVSPV